MRTLIDTLGGLFELLLLGIRTRFHFRGPYWRWRFETAFGSDPAQRPPRRQRVHAVIDYARWVYRMKQGR